MARYIGLMSGTSLDGVDGVLVEGVWGPRGEPGVDPAADDSRVEANPVGTDGAPRVLAHVHRAYAPPLKARLLGLNASGGVDELHHAALAANEVARCYAQVVVALLQASGLGAQDIVAIGAHGQTVRHQPGRHDRIGYTVQLLNAALLAESTGIDVVCDFRSRDVEAGGQGAPLVPAFHARCFAHFAHPVAVLNLGGIANLTLLSPGGREISGFDCGPGNALMDGWCHRHRGSDWDEDGRWAAQGTVDAGLLQRMLSEPFFAAPPPKSTGRDLFGLAWLDGMLREHLGSAAVVAPVDVQATLAALSAHGAADALRRHQPLCRRLLVCGGGARNGHLLSRLAALLPGTEVTTTEHSSGVAVDHVEAMAFAWLAAAFIAGTPGNVPSVTGARGTRRLGAFYPAR